MLTTTMAAWRVYNVNIGWEKVLFVNRTNVFVGKIFLKAH